MQAADERRYGRRGFLLLVGGGLSSLVWAGPVSRLFSPLTSAASQLVSHLRNTELVFVCGPDRAAVEECVSGVIPLAV